MIKMILFSILTLTTYATIIEEESNANKNGKLCIKNIYQNDNFVDLDKINSKVSCIDKVTVNEKGEIKSLNCPSDPFFEDYFSNGSSHRYKNTCLRNNRNSTVNLFENVNCECVHESLKSANDDKDYSQKLKAFKDKLRDKALANLGKRLTTKINNLKKSDRSLSWDNDKKYCFNQNTKVILNKMITNSRCNTKGIADRINKAFGENLGIKIPFDTNQSDSLAALIEGLQAPEKDIKEIGKKSCFKDGQKFGNYYNSWSNHPGFVSLKDTFGDFLKSNSTDSYTLKDDFYKYIRKNKIKLHPTLEVIAQNKLKYLLKDIKQAISKGDMDLEKFLLSDNKKWELEASKLVNKTCAYVVKDLKSLICPKTDFAFDDPEFIEMIYTDQENSKEKAQDSINDDDLELKALYCKNKDIHQVDENAKSLSIKAKYKKKRQSEVETYWLSSKDFSSVLNSKSIVNGISATKEIKTLFDLSFKDVSLSKEDKTNRKLGIINAFIDNTFMNGKVLQNFSDKIEKGETLNKRSRIGHVMKAANMIRRKLLQEKVDTVKEMGREIYQHTNKKLTPSEFGSKFLNSYNERNYNKKFTEYFKYYDAKPFNKKDSCAESFNQIYCANESKVMSGVADMNKLSCFRNKLPDVMKSYLKKAFNGVKSPSSICDYSKSIQTASTSQQSDLLNHVTKFFENEEIYKEGGFCQEKTFAQVSSNDSKNFSINDLDKNRIGYVIGTKVRQTGKFNVEKSIHNVAESMKNQNKTPSVFSSASTSTNDIFNGTESKENKSTRFNSGINSFTNFALPNSGKESEEDKTEKRKIEIDKAISEDEQNLRNYISELESKIRNNENKLSKSSNLTESDEIKQLNSEIKEMKESSLKLKNKLEQKIENRKKNHVTKTAAPQFSNGSIKSNTPDAKSYKNNTKKDFDKIKTESQSQQIPNTENIQKQSYNINLKSDSENVTQLVENSSVGKSEEKIVSVNYDNLNYKIALRVSKDGEILCEFADERQLKELKLDQKKLDSICEDYKENNSREIATQLKNNSSKQKVQLKEKIEIKREQKFKVQDLNHLLKN